MLEKSSDSGLMHRTKRRCRRLYIGLSRLLRMSHFPPGLRTAFQKLRLRHQTDGRSRPESLLPEVVAICCFLAFVWVSIFVALHHEYLATESAAEQTTGNLARAFEESTRRAVSQIDQVLLSARAFYKAQGTQFDFDEWSRTQTLSDKMTAAIGMADSTGHVFADTLPVMADTSIADRPHFRAQVDPTHDQLFISHPVHGRVSGQDTIQFTRKLLGPHGEFAGVTVFSLGCIELSRFYETLDLGRGFVALLSTDGTILARGPLVPGLIGTKSDTPISRELLSERSGTIRFRGKVTGMEQLASFRRLEDYPLIVIVGLDATTAFGQYSSLSRRALLSGVGVTLAISLIGALWLQQKRRSVASRRALAITLETISQGILMVDAEGKVPVFNPRALDFLGLAHGELGEVQKFAAARASELAGRGELADDNGASSRANAGELEKTICSIQATRDDGTVIDVRSHKLPGGGFVYTYTDVTEQHRADARVRYLAHHDTLTGLANRVQLRQRIADVLKRPADTLQLTAFMMLDLDGFKDINDTLGHDVGDELLVIAARRLQGLVREDDVVARLGGDEFVILQMGLTRSDEAASLAERILHRLSEPADIGGHQVQMGASIGIALHPNDGQTDDDLFKHADIALYCAKTEGRGTFRYFDMKMTHAVFEHQLLATGLRRALDDGELEVHFQPIFDCSSLRVAGFEALIRWQHPTRGLVPPDVFIKVAESGGLISRLGQWVIGQACAAASAWDPPCRVAVNVSPIQLRDGTLQREIAAVLARTGLPAGLLELEVTENVMADDNRIVLDTLLGLKAMGIRIALDDFGTGYSSLSYLRRFPFDKIKIDRSFVQGQASDQGVRVILEAILNMCENLNLGVVGEGVETLQQLAMLRDSRCTEVQGFLLGAAMPGGAVVEFLKDNARRLGQENGLPGTSSTLELAS